MRPAGVVVNPLGVRPNVSVGNKGLAPVLVPDVPTAAPVEAAFIPRPEFAAKADGFDVADAGAVVGSGNCPQLVVRVGSSRVDTGGFATAEAVEFGVAEATGTELVKGGTGNAGEPVAVVEGRVVPLVAPDAEAAGSIGRPARSTVCVRVGPASAREGGTAGKLKPDPAAPELSGLRTVIEREVRAAFKTQPAESLPSSGIATGVKSLDCPAL